MGERAASKELYLKNVHYGLLFGIFFAFDEISPQAKVAENCIQVESFNQIMTDCIMEVRN